MTFAVVVLRRKTAKNSQETRSSRCSSDRRTIGGAGFSRKTSCRWLLIRCKNSQPRRAGAHVCGAGVHRSVMGDPRAVEGILDATVAGLDDFGGTGADKGVEGLGSDCVDDAFADPFRIETRRGEAFGQYRFFIGADLGPARVVRAVAGHACDIPGDGMR